MLRPTFSRPVLSWNKAPIWDLRPDFYYCQIVADLLVCGALSDERTGLSFTISAGPRQRSYSRVRVPWDSRPYLLYQIRDFPFCRFLRLAGLRWRYSTPPPHGSEILRPAYNPTAPINRKHSSSIAACLSAAVPTWSLLSQSIGALATA
jgi:hypothetical protein